MSEFGNFYSPLEVSQILGVSTDVVYAEIKKNILVANKVGGSLRVSSLDMKDYIDRTKTTNQATTEPINKDSIPPRVRQIRNKRKAKQCA